jgi:hypothetical protein
MVDANEITLSMVAWLYPCVYFIFSMRKTCIVTDVMQLDTTL